MGCRLDSYELSQRSTQSGPPELSFRNQSERCPCRSDRSTALALWPIDPEDLLSPISLTRTGPAEEVSAAGDSSGTLGMGTKLLRTRCSADCRHWDIQGTRGGDYWIRYLYRPLI